MIGVSIDSLETLYLRLEARRGSRVPSDSWSAHCAVLDRLAANILVAQGAGWTACAIERAGTGARFRGWGVPPWTQHRHPIPCWSTDHA